MRLGLGALLFIILIGILAIPGNARTVVVINSQDWIDVYSGMLYARLQSSPGLFMTGQKYVTLLPDVVPLDDEVLVLESGRFPFSSGLARKLERQGYSANTLYSTGGRGMNLELARRLNATRFIIVDPAYGFNAISAGPYAVITNAFVLFADEKNIGVVAGFLSSLPSVDGVLVYGQVSESVRERLERFSPEIIDTGSKYEDNAELLRKYFARSPLIDQAFLTSGGFIETNLLDGAPIVLLGQERVQDVTIEAVKASPLKTAVLVGNELTTPAKVLKDATGVQVFVKVGQGVPKGISEYEPIKALDMLPLPVPLIEIDLGVVQYNVADKMLEVVYHNRGNRVFLTGTITVLADGSVVQTVGDEDFRVLETNQTMGFRYAVDLSEQVAREQNITADLLTIYGESPRITDRAISAQMPVGIATAEDDCVLELESVEFSERTQRFGVTLKNPSGNECHASISLLGVVINDAPQNLNHSGPAVVPAGASRTFKIRQRMTPVDIEDNPSVHARVFYGRQEGLLFRVIDQTVPLRKSADVAFWVIVSIIALLIVLVLVFFVLWVRARRAGLHWRREQK
jgi:hypothetical protein